MIQPSEMDIEVFRKGVLEWASTIERPMPWRSERDPYRVWLSEIILQQTRVEQGLPYYQAFIRNFPDVTSLAAASEDVVLKLWEGLGYYSRARNLHYTAKYIVDHCEGKFPSRYDDIRALRGVGDYTAAAIASFAYDMPYAVVDGNVVRVLARYCGVHTPADTSQGKKLFAALAEQFLDKEEPAIYNQAIMDFGAVQCTPKQPLCMSCVLAPSCAAYRSDAVGLLPKKLKKVEKSPLYFWFVVVNIGDHVLIRKRVEKNIWKNLYEFPAIIHPDLQSFENRDVENEVTEQLFLGEKNKFKISSISEVYRQDLTHRKISALFIEVEIKQFNTLILEKYISVNRTILQTNFVFPKVIIWYLEK